VKGRRMEEMSSSSISISSISLTGACAQCPHEDAELIRVELHDCLSRVRSVLARAEGALRKLQVVLVVPLVHELQVGSIDETEGCLYGDFSLRARSCSSPLQEVSSISGSEVITKVVAIDQQLMYEIKERCEEPLVVLPTKMCSLDALAVPMMSSPPLAERCQLPASVDCGGLDGALAPNSEALLQKSFVACLVVWRWLTWVLAKRLLASYRRRLPGRRSKK
jgi:hypothetical protein